MPVGKSADEIVERARAIPVAPAIVGRLDLGDPVDELQAVAAGFTDRVDHHLAMRQPARARQARARQDRLPPRDAAPHVDAGIARLALIGEKLLADHRIDAVAGNRGASAHALADGIAGADRKMQGDAVVVLLDAGAVMVGENAVGAGAALEGFQQHHLQVAAMNRELRMVVAGRAPERLLIDQLAEAVEEGRILRRDRNPRQIGLKPKRGKFLGGVRQEVDADADRADFRLRIRRCGRECWPHAAPDPGSGRRCRHRRSGCRPCFLPASLWWSRLCTMKHD